MPRKIEGERLKLGEFRLPRSFCPFALLAFCSSGLPDSAFPSPARLALPDSTILLEYAAPLGAGVEGDGEIASERSTGAWSARSTSTSIRCQSGT